MVRTNPGFDSRWKLHLSVYQHPHGDGQLDEGVVGQTGGPAAAVEVEQVEAGVAHRGDEHAVGGVDRAVAAEAVALVVGARAVNLLDSQPSDEHPGYKIFLWCKWRDPRPSAVGKASGKHARPGSGRSGKSPEGGTSPGERCASIAT